jgi:serine/threonine protein phosphatase 1
MRTIIIGDIHGCSGALRLILAKLSPDPDTDRLILLGDLFDRGPDSWGVYYFVRELAEKYGSRFVLLRGNHEDYLLRTKMSFGDRLVWERVGRRDTVRSFKKHGEKMESAAPWLKEHVSDYYRDEEGRFQCVHAGLKIDPIELNDAYTMFHDHSVVQQNRYAGPLTIVGHIALENPAWFMGDAKTVRQIKENMWHDLPQTGILCIDAGCGKGGRLVGMMIEDNRYMLFSAGEDG